ncbi:DUF1176 domain-containing protein [Shigella flexneri]
MKRSRWLTQRRRRSHSKNDVLLDYGNWRMNGLRCSLNPLRREANVTALTDDKALMMISCEAGAYNTIDLAWIVSRKKPLASRPVRLRFRSTTVRRRMNWN